MAEKPTLERETYLAERRSLVEAEHEQSQAFDRAILTLSAGALGLSMTFIHEIVPTFDKATLKWLVLGWGCLILSLLLTLISFHTSQSAMRRQREIIDALYDAPGDGIIQQGNCPARLTGVANSASLFLFVLGAGFLATFVALNLWSQ